MIRKFHTAGSPQEIAPRTFRGTASTTSVDRDRDRILGWDTEEFRRNPVLLLDHDHRMPIGKVNEVVDHGNKLDVVFELLPAGVSHNADFAYEALRHGTLRGLSIGYIEGRTRKNDFGGIDYEKPQVIELSLTAVQANPDARAARLGGKGGEDADNTGSDDAGDADTLTVKLVDFACVIGKRGRVLNADNERRIREAAQNNTKLAQLLGEVLAQLDSEDEEAPASAPVPVPAPPAPAQESPAPKQPVKSVRRVAIRLLPTPDPVIPVTPDVVAAATVAALQTLVHKAIQRHTGRLD